jgi:hypothetical protein
VGAGQRRTMLIVAGLEVDGGRRFLRLDRYRSVVIWCRRFTYAFGAAGLLPAR